MDSLLLIRYGAMRRIGWFAVDGGSFERGSDVVVQSSRGQELGEILAVESCAESGRVTTGRVLRPACPDDRTRAAELRRDQARRVALCESVFGEGRWPFDLIDVETLLDETTVVYYLGPHGLETEGLRQAFLERHGLTLRFEPAGADEPGEEEADAHGGCGSCGTSGGGCGSGDGGGCGSCGVKDLVARRRAVSAR